MSDHITADLEGDFERVLYHVGDTSTPLVKWRQLLGAVRPYRWSEVRKHAPDVMQLISESRVLHTAAMALKRGGPKAAGPNQLRLEELCGNELWSMCNVLEEALRTDKYRRNPSAF